MFLNKKYTVNNLYSTCLGYNQTLIGLLNVISIHLYETPKNIINI